MAFSFDASGIVTALKTLMKATWTDLKHIEETDLDTISAEDSGLPSVFPFAVVEIGDADVEADSISVNSYSITWRISIYYVTTSTRAANTRTAIRAKLAAMATALANGKKLNGSWVRITDVMTTGGDIGRAYSDRSGNKIMAGGLSFRVELTERI